MAIVFGNDIGVEENTFEGTWSKMKSDLDEAWNGMKTAFSGSVPANPVHKENVHVDTGWSNVPGTAFVGSEIDHVDDIKQRKVVSQEPQLTVYIKKRAFWGLRNENNTNLLDRGEKLFLRATKILFEKKCSQIGAYEALTKASRLLSENTSLDGELIDRLIDYLSGAMDEYTEGRTEELNDSLNQSIEQGLNPGDALSVYSSELNDILQNYDDFQKDIAPIIEGLQELRKRNIFTKHETRTNWVVNSENDADLLLTGRGTGVIELTLITNINTSLGIDGDKGSISFNMEDPYNLTKITTQDIEAALSAANEELGEIEAGIALGMDTSSLNRGPKYYLDLANDKDAELKKIRKNKLLNDIDYFTGGRLDLASDSVNNVIGGVESPEIVFEVDISSSAPNKVSGSLVGSDVIFNEGNFQQIMFANLPLEHVPGPQEITLIREIFSALNNYVESVSRINTTYRETNRHPDVSHARINLRKHYLGKSIIQPMDSVNVYIRGNTFSDDSLVGPLNAVIKGTSFIRQFEDDHSTSHELLKQEMDLFGINSLNIPVELYQAVRTSGMLRNAGAHVFGGVITDVSESFSEGKYTTSVRGESNLRWLDLSRLNVSPSLDQTQGVLEDPLTPFDIIVDDATGLIKEAVLTGENQRRKDAGELRFDITSLYPGKKINETEASGNLQQDYFISDNGDVLARNKHPPGMVYKWKNGIMAVTRNLNLRTALDGSEDNTARLRREVGLTVVPKPFAGQDAANIISMLVTGVPHNYDSFYDSAMSVGTFNDTEENNPQTYFHSFFDITNSTNRTLGNFEATKIVSRDPMSTHDRIKRQRYLKTESKKINDIRLQLAKYRDDLYKLTQLSNITGEGQAEGVIAEKQRSTQNDLNSIIGSLEDQLNDAIKEFNSKSSNISSRIYGVDPAFDGSKAGTNESESENIKQTASELRLRNTLIQMRPQYDCKLNMDSNKFIIGDEYDKDLDLQAFAIQALGSKEIDLWNSEFKTPLEICRNVAQTMDFEFYCDTEGNIQFRPPRYNKVPLSLLLKMLMLDQREGKKVYPSSLSSLFDIKYQSYKDEREIVDLQIKIETILLGGTFAVEASVDQVSEFVINDETFEASEFGLDARLDTNLVNELIDTKAELASRIGGDAPQINVEEDRKKAEEEIKSLNNPSEPNINVKRERKHNKLAQLVSRRQKLLEIEDKLKRIGDKYDTGVMGKSMQDILERYEDIVEDDYNDLVGPGSSKRYIIYDDQIISYDFTESDREVLTRVNVTGQQDLVGGAGEIGGVPILWAGATDFDMWRQYGYRAEVTTNKPYFKDAESQCAPYAMMLLSRSRRNAVTGQVVVYGNEFYQLGDVVYINSRDMLFYVTGISHSLSYEGGNFTTTLTLKYGHPLGDYIPTPMDIVGKGIIKNQRQVNKTNTSREVASKTLGVHIAAVKFPKEAFGGAEDPVRGEKIAMLSGTWAYKNVNKLKGAITKTYKHLSVSGYPKLEVRGFATKNTTDTELIRKRMQVVREWLQNPVGRYIKNYDDFIIISDPRYVERSIQTSQISDWEDPVDVTSDELEMHEIARLPRQEVFNLRDIDGLIENVVEIVMIFEEIEEESSDE
jgi:hypothetical protein